MNEQRIPRRVGAPPRICGYSHPHAKDRIVPTLLLMLALMFAGLTAAFPAQAITALSRQVVVIDVESRDVLWQKNSTEQMTPSSMTKVMTAYLVFSALNRGEVSLSTEFVVSERAARRGGSTMLLPAGRKVTVHDLLRGLIVASGNDAAITLAEGLAGSEERFAVLMNQTAAALGMKNTNFVNASGWPEPGHVSTALDMTQLGLRLISDHWGYYEYFTASAITYRGSTFRNRNPILGKLGVDGIKTGRTQDGGYGVMLSAAADDGRRVLVVLNGAKNEADRKMDAENLIDWALTHFDNHSLFAAGQVIAYAPVWLGTTSHIPLVAKVEVRMTIPVQAYRSLRAQLSYNSPIPAPIQRGQEVGSLIVTGPGIKPHEVPVLAGASVDSVGRLERVSTGIRYIVFGLPE